MSEHLSKNEGLVKFERKEVDIAQVLQGLKSESDVHKFATEYDFAALDSGQKAEFAEYIIGLLDTKRNKREWDVQDVEPPFRLSAEHFCADFDQLLTKLEAKGDERVQEMAGDMALARVIYKKHPSFQDVDHSLTQLEAFQIALKDQNTSLTPWDFQEAFGIANGIGKLDELEHGKNKKIFVTQAASILQDVLGAAAAYSQSVDAAAAQAKRQNKKAPSTKFDATIKNVELFDYVHPHNNTAQTIEDQAHNFEELAGLNRVQLRDFMKAFLREQAMEKLSPAETLAIEGKFSGKAVLEAVQRRKEIGAGTQDL